jgi:hypothetical protein
MAIGAVSTVFLVTVGSISKRAASSAVKNQ